MLEEISIEFPQDPLTQKNIREWLDAIGLHGKLKGHDNPTSLFGLASGTLAEFVQVSKIPEEEGGSVLWAYLRGVEKQRGKCS
jgi:hypothetical protein